jgi:hypothetical protein
MLHAAAVEEGTTDYEHLTSLLRGGKTPCSSCDGAAAALGESTVTLHASSGSKRDLDRSTALQTQDMSKKAQRLVRASSCCLLRVRGALTLLLLLLGV